MASFFTSKVDALKILDGTNTILVGSVTEVGDVGAGVRVFDPLTGKSWLTSAGAYPSTWTEQTETMTAGTTDNAILKWDSGTSTWVEEPDFTVTDAGLATAAAGLVATTGGVTASAGNIVATTGNITASAGNISATAGSVSAGTTVTAGTGVTATTGGVTASAGNIVATLGNVTATAGSVSAGTTVTGGTGVIATTGGVTATAGGLTATAGGLTVTAGTTDINDTTNISGAVTLDNAAANSLTMTGTTNAVSLNGSGATSITLGGTTSTITLSGSGTKSVTGLSTPSNSTDAANKAYVDSLAAGLDPKESVRLATTGAVSASYFIMSNAAGAGNGVILTVSGGSGTFDPDAGETIVTSGGTGTIVGVDHATAGTTTKIYIGGITGSALTTSFTSHSGGVTGLTISAIDTTSVVAFLAYNAVGAATIDSVAPALNNRVLFKDQSTADHNGIYNVKVIGSATLTQVVGRASDQDGTPTNEISTGNFTFVSEGTANTGKGYVLSSTDGVDPDNIAVHTDTKVFTQFSSAGGGVTSIPTESGTATPSSGSLTITGSPSINTSASGSTVTVALAADLDTGATGFTVANYRVPFATAANTLGDSANITFDNTYKVVGVGDAASAPINSALIFNSSAGSGISTFGVAEPIAGVLLATNTNSPALGVTTGQTSGSGITGDLTVKSGASISTGSSGAAVFGSGNGGSGGSGAVTLASGTTSGTRGSITLAGNVINLNGLATNAVVLTSAATDQETGSTTDAVATIALIRENVVLRKTGTTSVALAANAGAAKYLVYVVGNTAAERYASEVMVTSTNATTGVDSVEYSIVSGTTPAALSIVASAASGLVTLTVTQTAGTIVVEAIPLV